MACDKPLTEVGENDNVMSLVVGTPTTTEDNVIKKLSCLGLGFGVDRSSNTDLSPSTSIKPSEVEPGPGEPEEDQGMQGAVPTPSTSAKSNTVGRIPVQTTSMEGTSTMGTKPSTETVSNKLTIVVKLEKLQVNTKDSVTITPEMLDSLPKSHYCVIPEDMATIINQRSHDII